MKITSHWMIFMSQSWQSSCHNHRHLYATVTHGHDDLHVTHSDLHITDKGIWVSDSDRQVTGSVPYSSALRQCFSVQIHDSLLTSSACRSPKTLAFSWVGHLSSYFLPYCLVSQSSETGTGIHYALEKRQIQSTSHDGWAWLCLYQVLPFCFFPIFYCLWGLDYSVSLLLW